MRIFFCLLVAATSLPLYAQQSEKPANEPTMAKSLDGLLAGSRSLDEFVLELTWESAGKETSLTLYGDGLGIHWQGKQFRISADQRLAILRKLKAASFLTLPEKLGELPKGEKAVKPGSHPGQGLISLRIGGQSKTVQHAGDGTADETFVRLATELTEMGVKESATGIGVGNLADGLQKILEKKLDPRALKIKEEYLRHLACHTFEVQGLVAKIGGLGYVGDPFKGEKSLSVDELTTFVKKLQQEKFCELPKGLNLTDDIFVISVTVRVLDKEHRAYGHGYTSKKSPEEQLQRLHAVWSSTMALHPPYNYEKRKWNRP